MTTLNKIAKEEYLKIYNGLPSDIQAILFADESAEEMLKIKNKYSLDNEPFSNLVKLVGRTMMGLFEIKKFVQLINELVQVDAKTAKVIAQDINLAIFQPVRESLMMVHGITSDANTQMHANDANQINQSMLPAPTESLPQQSQADFEAQRQREELLAQLKKQNDGNMKDSAPYQARPVSYRVPLKNIVDLRKLKRKSRNNGFFS